MNINKGLGLIALAIVCSTVFAVTESFWELICTAIVGVGVVLHVCN